MTILTTARPARSTFAPTLRRQQVTAAPRPPVRGGTPAWSVRLARRLLVDAGLPEHRPYPAIDGFALAYTAPGVTVTRVQDGSRARPGRRRRARRRWDAAFAMYRDVLEHNGFRLVRGNDTELVLAAPPYHGTPVTARVERRAPGTYQVTFDGCPGAAGTIELTTTGDAFRYEVRTGSRQLVGYCATSDAGTRTLARHYGLPPVVVTRHWSLDTALRSAGTTAVQLGIAWP